MLETISGELPEELPLAEERGGRLWLPFSQAIAEALLELRGARLDKRARCAARRGCRSARSRRPRRSSLVESVGEPRFTLDVNWDPDTIPAFLALPACEAHGRSLPVDPYLVEPLEHYLRTYGVEVAPNAREVLERLRAEHDAGDRGRPALARARRAGRWRPRALGGELRPFQRAGVAYVLGARRTFLADEQGLGKTVQALAALEEDDAFPPSWSARRQPQAQLGARGRALAARTARVAVVSGTGTVAPAAEITIVNYDIVHAHRARLALRKPRRSCSTSRTTSRTRARSARRRCGGSPSRCAPDALRLALTGTPVMNHAEELIAQLRILGRLEDFGSGARFARRFQGIGAEERIHWHLRRSCFVRRAKADVLPQLPGQAPGRGAGRRSTTSASTGSPRRT